MKKAIKRMLIIAACIIAAAAAVNLYVVGTAGKYILPDDTDWQEFNARGVIVLGCAVKNGSEPSLMLADRINTAIRLYDEMAADEFMVTGDHRNDDYNEVGVMKDRMVDGGIPADDIYMDHLGLNTSDSMVHAAEYFGKGRVIIVTQKYHLYRAVYLARAYGLDAYGVPTESIQYRGQLYREGREILARVKDFANVMMFSGSGDSSQDED